MTEPDRRRFIKSAVATVPAVAVLARPSRWLQTTPVALDDELLRALAEAVLPSSLSVGDVRRILADFQQWLSAYQPGAERNHAYGSGDISHLPADPSPRWQRQLQDLDREAQRIHGIGWTRIDVDRRQEIVTRRLARQRGGSLGTAIQAEHVAVALMARFHGSPEGVNLAYQAAINPRVCRPLDQSPAQPLTLPERS